MEKFELDFMVEKEHPFLENEELSNKLSKFTFNLKTGKAEARTLAETSFEFPTIN